MHAKFSMPEINPKIPESMQILSLKQKFIQQRDRNFQFDLISIKLDPLKQTKLQIQIDLGLVEAHISQLPVQ